MEKENYELLKCQIKEMLTHSNSDRILYYDTKSKQTILTLFKQHEDWIKLTDYDILQLSYHPNDHKDDIIYDNDGKIAELSDKFLDRMAKYIIYEVLKTS